MRSFRLRLILALIAGITVVSVASTYFEMLARKHMLRHDLEVRTGWLGTSLQPDVEQALTAGITPEIAALAGELRSHQEELKQEMRELERELKDQELEMQENQKVVPWQSEADI